jgi:large subunit ribosomal protein L25
MDPVAVSVSPKEINKILHSSTGGSTIFNLDIQGGENTPVMIVDWQHQPLKGTLLHVDFKRIDLTKRLTVKILVHPQGEPKGVKQQSGLHEVVTREVTIECLPDDIPEAFMVDVTELMLGQALRAGDLPLPAGVTLVSPREQVISHVVAMRAVAVEETPAEGAEPVAGAAAAAEPEVIKKGKKEEEGAAEKGEKKK